MTKRAVCAGVNRPCVTAQPRRRLARATTGSQPRSADCWSILESTTRHPHPRLSHWRKRQTDRWAPRQHLRHGCLEERGEYSGQSDREGDGGVWRANSNGEDVTRIQENARLAVMGEDGALLYQPTDKPGLWYQPSGAKVARQVSPASLSPLARLHFAHGAFWVVDRAEGRTMQVWRFTPNSGLTAVPGASGPVYPKSQISIEPRGETLVADLVGPTACSAQHRTFGLLQRTSTFASLWPMPWTTGRIASATAP